jgi:hypothetical protein
MFYSSTDAVCVTKSRRMSQIEHVSYIREIRNAYRILVGRPGRKRSLERVRFRWDDNTKWMLKK